MRFLLRFSLGVLLALLATEGLLRLLPVSSATYRGYHISPEIITYPPHTSFTVATGWDLRNAHNHRSNNYGFVDTSDFKRSPDAVAVVGDSFVDANMLAESDRISAVLESLIAPRQVLALGGPGSSLLDYVERVHLANEKFGIRQFVLVLERGDIAQSICGSGNIHGPCFDSSRGAFSHEHQPEAGLLKKILRESALAQYLFSQLKVDISAPLRALSAIVERKEPQRTVKTTQERSPDAPPASERDPILKHFFEGLQQCVGCRFALVLDANRSRLDEPASVAQGPANRLLMDQARKLGMNVVDLGPIFLAHYRQHRLSLSVGPYDGHWNVIAHRLAAEAVAQQFERATTTSQLPSASIQPANTALDNATAR